MVKSPSEGAKSVEHRQKSQPRETQPERSSRNRDKDGKYEVIVKSSEVETGQPR
jgi:hypothetical protein